MERFHAHNTIPPKIEFPNARIPTELDEYLFDLNGFLVLRGVPSKEEVADANARIDQIPRSMPRLGWHGWVQREDHPEHRGISYQQDYALGGSVYAHNDYDNTI